VRIVIVRSVVEWIKKLDTAILMHRIMGLLVPGLGNLLRNPISHGDTSREVADTDADIGYVREFRPWRLTNSGGPYFVQSGIKGAERRLIHQACQVRYG